MLRLSQKTHRTDRTVPPLYLSLTLGIIYTHPSLIPHQLIPLPSHCLHSSHTLLLLTPHLAHYAYPCVLIPHFLYLSFTCSSPTKHMVTYSSFTYSSLTYHAVCTYPSLRILCPLFCSKAVKTFEICCMKCP